MATDKSDELKEIFFTEETSLRASEKISDPELKKLFDRSPASYLKTSDRLSDRGLRGEDLKEQLIRELAKLKEFAEPKRKRTSIADYRRQLKWLYDLIDQINVKRPRRSRDITNGKFFSFEYLPHGDHISPEERMFPFYDRRPVILCLNDTYDLHYFKKRAQHVGFLGVNLHYLPIDVRRRIVKKTILNMPQNRTNFINNRELNIASFYESDVGRYNALRQYHYFGPKFFESTGKSYMVGAINIVEIPYTHLTELLEIPSIYEADFYDYK